MTKRLLRNAAGKLLRAPWPALLAIDDADGPISIRPPERMCCPCKPYCNGTWYDVHMTIEASRAAFGVVIYGDVVFPSIPGGCCADPLLPRLAVNAAFPDIWYDYATASCAVDGTVLVYARTGAFVGPALNVQLTFRGGVFVDGTWNQGVAGGALTGTGSLWGGWQL
jgi:hypothetical protein